MKGFSSGKKGTTSESPKIAQKQRMLLCVDNLISNTREAPSLLENSNTVEGWEPKNIKNIKCKTENGPDGYHNNKY